MSGTSQVSIGAGHERGTARGRYAGTSANWNVTWRPFHRVCQLSGAKLRILIHTHDTFKADAKRGVAIWHPQSHASLARAFLGEFCDDEDLLAMVQLHDEPYALFLQTQRTGRVNECAPDVHLEDDKRLGSLCRFLDRRRLYAREGARAA